MYSGPLGKKIRHDPPPCALALGLQHPLEQPKGLDEPDVFFHTPCGIRDERNVQLEGLSSNIFTV